MPQALDARERQRNLLFMADPKRWSQWPFLPLVRRPGRDGDDYECGLLCDLQEVFGLAGYRCTVFLSNLFCLPGNLDGFIALPRETFDTFEEVLAAGWRVD